MQGSFTRHLPNALTVLNLLSGCLAAVSVIEAEFGRVAFFIAAGLFFDLLDGLAARALKVSSPFGKELDSLADMVTFGFLPGLCMYWMFTASDISLWFDKTVSDCLSVIVPFLITAFSALRLAKFNLDTRQSQGFIGLPTPANTIWIVALPLISVNLPGEFDFLLKNALVLMSLTFLSCWLLVAEIPMLSFKMSSFSPARYPAQFLLVATAVLLVLLFSYASPPLIILFYVLLSVFMDFKKRTS